MLLRPLIPALVASLWCGGVVAATHPAPQPVSLNFPNTDVDAVARAMAAIMGRPVVVDPRVVGKLSLYTDSPVSPAQAQAMFAASLRGMGFALVESQGLFKVVPEAEGKVQAGLLRSEGAGNAQDQVGTQVFRLVHENASNMVAVLRPLISANNTVNVNAGNNSLVITDYVSNLNRLQRLIAALDTPSATDVEVIPLQHAMATAMAYTVQKLMDGGGAAAAPGAASAANGISVVPDVFGNALLVKAPNQARLASVRALIARLDQAGAGALGGSNVHVVYLQHADATRLAPVLRASFAAPAGRMAASGGEAGRAGLGASDGVVSGAATEAGGAVAGAASAGKGASSGGGSSTTGTSAQAAAPATALGQPVTGGYIQAEPASNALIVTAPMALFRQMQAVIAQLDTPRAQVYVESLVVEVDASRSYDVGVKWKEIFNISSSTDLTLGTVASAVAAQSGTNILSTANVVTLDNEEARIVVGQNVPFVTGSYTNASTSSSGSVNPFTTVERKDVGLTLRVRPQVGEGGTVRMTVFQEKSSVDSSSTNSSTGLTTNKSSIETTVVIDDGATLVLGGLLQDDFGNGDSQVPVLGDIPIIGNLFKSRSRTRKKTNLMVFLRPVVIRNQEDSNRITLDRYDYMRQRQSDSQPEPSTVLGKVNKAPEMDPLKLSNQLTMPSVRQPLDDPNAPQPNVVMPSGSGYEPKLVPAPAAK